MRSKLLSQLFLTLFCAFTFNVAFGQATDLFFSEYVEGSSNNKYLEIYNGTGATVNLSGYQVRLHANGTTGITSSESLSGTLADGAVIVLRNSSAALSGVTGTVITSSVCNYNGDDAVSLWKGSIMIDVIGRIGCDPGSSWSAGGNNTTSDNTLVRNSSVCGGITVNPSGSCNSSSFPTLGTEWTGYSQNTHFLGSHTASCAATPCAAPNAATALNFTNVTGVTTDGSFTASSGGADGYVVVRKTTAGAPTVVNGTTYSTGGGLGGQIISVGSSTSFTQSGLTPATTYYYYVYAYNNTACSGGPAYSAVLSGTQATTTPVTRVEFVSTTGTVTEGTATYTLTLSITNPSASAATSANVYITGGPAARINGFSNQTVTFPANSSANQTVTLTVTNNTNCEGTDNLSFGLQNITGGSSAIAGTNSTFALTVEDDDLTNVGVAADDFEATILTGWNNTGHWASSTVQPINGSRSLRHSNFISTGNSSSYIYGSYPGGFDPADGEITWRFILKNTWDPSSSNNFWYVLMSDQLNLLSSPSLNGYAIGVNMNGTSDEIILYRLDGGATASTEILNTGEFWTGTSGDTYAIEVTRSTTGEWEVKYANTNSFASLTSGGTVTDITHTTANYHGLAFNYSSSRSGWLFLDDVEIGQLGCSTPVPTINAAGPLNFGNVNVGSTSTEQSYNLTTTDLTGNVLIDAPADYGLSTTSGGPYTNTLNLTPAQAANTTIYVVYQPTSTGANNGVIEHTSAGATQVDVAVTGTGTTPCIAPANQATNLTFSNIAFNSLNGAFTAASPAADGYLVVRSTSATLSGNPVNGNTYSAGNTLGGGTVVSVGATTSFADAGLSTTTTYYYFVFAYNNTACTGGPLYKTPALSNNATTTASPFVAFDNFDRSSSSTVGIPSSGGAVAWGETEAYASQCEVYNNARLDINNNNPAGHAWTYFDMTGKYATTFNNTADKLVWAFNMALPNNSSPSGFNNSNYGIAFVLGATSTDFADAGNGYAVVFGQSGPFDEIRLVHFTGGLISGTHTDIVGDGVGHGSENLDIMVEYAPATGTWTLSVHDGGFSFPFADPTGVTYTNVNSATNQTYTSIALPYMGAFYNYATSSGQYSSFDNFYIPTAQPVNNTYTWTPTTGTHDWTVPANWTPNRVTPTNLDVLVFDQGGSSTAFNVPTETISQMLVGTNTSIALRPATGSTKQITINGDTGDDLYVESGSTLAFDGNDGMEIDLNTGATALIGGDVIFRNTVNGAGRDHRIFSDDAAAIVFTSGAQFIAEDLTGNPFGSTGTQNVAIFQNGSTYIAIDGGNPFGFSQPQSKVTFQTGSLYIHESSTAPSLAGRTYADFEFNITGSLDNFFGSSSVSWNVDDLTITSGNIGFPLTGNNEPLNITVNGDLTVAAGATFNYSPVSDAAKSTITLNNSLHILGGAGTTNVGTYGKLLINADVLMDGAVTVQGVIDIDGGSLDTDNNVLTLKSDATATGMLFYKNGGTTTGDVTVQRYVSGASSRYHHFSTPVSDATILDFADDATLVGFPGSSNPGAFPNIYYYNETIADQDSMVGWTTPATLSGGLLLGTMQGWTINMPGNRVVDFIGLPHNGTQQRTVTYTPSGRYSNDGWNFVGNPFTAPIDWDLVAPNLPAGIDDAVYYWDPVSDQYAIYVGGASINGGKADVAIGQGFFIKKNANGSSANLVLSPNYLVEEPTSTFFRQSNTNSLLDIVVTGANGKTDQTIVRFNDVATDGFDKSFDGYKRRSSSNLVPTMYTRLMGDSTMYAVNSLGVITADLSIPLYFEAGVSQSFTLDAANIGSFDPTAMIFLEDTKTNQLIDLRANPTYTFTALATDAADRFVLHFYPPMGIDVNGQTCAGNDGFVEFIQPGSSVWNMTITDNLGNVVANEPAMNGTFNLNGLADGAYNVVLEHTSGYTVNQTINVVGVDPVTALFHNSILVTEVGQPVNFVNLSSGATNYTWNFGDGNTANTEHATHAFAYPGEYVVELLSANNDCNDSYTTTLKVNDVASGINELTENFVQVYSYNQTIKLRFSEVAGQFTVNVFDLIGRNMVEPVIVNTAGDYEISMNDAATGYYFVQIVGAESVLTKKLFLDSEQ